MLPRRCSRRAATVKREMEEPWIRLCTTSPGESSHAEGKGSSPTTFEAVGDGFGLSGLLNLCPGWIRSVSPPVHGPIKLDSADPLTQRSSIYGDSPLEGRRWTYASTLALNTIPPRVIHRNHRRIRMNLYSCYWVFPLHFCTRWSSFVLPD